MAAAYPAYLALLDEVRAILDRLTDLSRQKTDAIRRDDLAALDGVLKQEQVLSLSLRGLEQRRLTMGKELGLTNVPLSGLVEHVPDPLRPQAKRTADDLRSAYDLYRAAADAARITLECNLHEIEKIIAAAGVDPNKGTGYVPPTVEPPKNMKTDFRA